MPCFRPHTMMYPLQSPPFLSFSTWTWVCSATGSGAFAKDFLEPPDPMAEGKLDSLQTACGRQWCLMGPCGVSRRQDVQVCLSRASKFMSRSHPKRELGRQLVHILPVTSLWWCFLAELLYLARHLITENHPKLLNPKPWTKNPKPETLCPESRC